MAPQAVGLNVPHDHTFFPQLARNCKRKFLFADGTVIHDAVKTQLSPGGHDCLASQTIVEDLASWAE